jgi:hypothetical protein
MTKDKKAPYMGWLYVGDTSVDVHGYGDEDICEIYITDTDINVLEMIIELGGWDKFLESAQEACYEYRARTR